MRITTKTLFPVFSFAPVILLAGALAGCDVGDASPVCQMQVVGAQPNAPEGTQPWVALWITGDASCLDGVAEDLRVSMFDTSPAAYYRGDAALTSVQLVGNTTVCAVYKWPTWENGAANWSVVVTPPARASGAEDLPRAVGLAPSQVADYKTPSELPFWLVGDTFKLYLPSALNTANCWPGSGK